VNNFGGINGRGYTGGIIGRILSGTNTIDQVTNNVTVNGTIADVGGLIGGVTGNETILTLTNALNYGNISSIANNVAGIIGFVNIKELTLTQTLNYGIISGSAYSGGIAGKISGGYHFIDQVGNYGEIKTSGSDVGGLIGGLEATDPKLALTNAFNVGTVRINGSGNNAGGIC